MDIIWKVIGGSVVALVFGVILGKRNPDAAVVLNLLVCAMLLSAALGFLYPLLDFVRNLISYGELNSDKIQILMKATALGLISQVAGLLCADTGNSALGKGIEIAAVCAILWISLPLMSALMEIVQTILEQI